MALGGQELPGSLGGELPAYSAAGRSSVWHACPLVPGSGSGRSSGTTLAAGGGTACQSPYVTVCLSAYGFGRSLHYPGRTMVERLRTPIHKVKLPNRTRHPHPCTPPARPSRPQLSCLPPLAWDRCSTCSPFGCGQDALPNETVAQRGDHGSWPLKNAHNRTTAPKLRERPRSSREAP